MNSLSRRNMQILLVDPTFSLFHYDLELASALQRQLHNVTLIAAPALRDEGYAMPDPMPVIRGISLARSNPRARFLGRPLTGYDYYLNQAYLVQHLIRSREQVIVHIQFLSLFGRSPVDFRWLELVKRRSHRVVYTVHDVLPPDRHDNAALVAAYGRIYTAMDHLITHSQYQHDLLVERYGIAPAHISIIPHGPLFHRQKLPDRAQARDRLGLKRENPVILQFGNMRPYKGTELLIEAMPLVLNDFPQALLALAGSASADRSRDLQQCIASVGIADHVLHHFSYIPTSQLVDFFAVADVVVLPYQYIDQSGVLLSALALGLPVIASKVGGVAEAIESARIGYIFHPRTSDALAATISDVLSQPQRANATALRARDFVREELGWDRIAAQTIEVYRSLS